MALPCCDIWGNFFYLYILFNFLPSFCLFFPLISYFFPCFHIFFVCFFYIFFRFSSWFLFVCLFNFLFLPFTRSYLTALTHYIFDSFSPRKIFPASEEVFASTAELCSINFLLLFPLLWKQWELSPFFVLCTCWHCYSFLWYWPVLTNMFFRDRS